MRLPTLKVYWDSSFTQTSDGIRIYYPSLTTRPRSHFRLDEAINVLTYIPTYLVSAGKVENNISLSPRLVSSRAVYPLRKRDGTIIWRLRCPHRWNVPRELEQFSHGIAGQSTLDLDLVSYSLMTWGEPKNTLNLHTGYH